MTKKKHRLWYAVSRNLVHRYEINPPNENPSDPIINPSIVRNPIYPWLKVLDKNGNLISDHVAAVIINPENAIAGQNRAGVANVEQFLDAFHANGKTFSNRDYDSADEDFILGENMRNVDAKNSQYMQPYYFNDKLVYITIDELVRALEQRAGLEAKSLLNEYKNKNGSYPFAAPLGSHDVNAVLDNESGMLPYELTYQCGCTNANKCSCSFDAVSNLKFSRNDGVNWTSRSGACTRYTSACNCKGAGMCTTNDSSFICDSKGECIYSPSPTNVSLGQYTFSVKDNLKVYKSVASCTDRTAGSLIEATCTDNGTFVISTWLWKNLWQDYIFYHYSPTSSLQVGSKTGVQSLVISAGDAIVSTPFSVKGGPQNRPSPLNDYDYSTIVIDDYLDSIENINEDNIYDSSSKLRSSNYNDLIFIVNP